MYLTIKSLHLIFIVTWFAALFYMPRLMVYAAEIARGDAPQHERDILLRHLLQWQRRLWLGIATPSAILTLVMGCWLVGLQYFPDVPTWLWVKLAMLVLLYGYHLVTHRLFGQQARYEFRYSGDQLRLWNEVPTLLLFGIVFQVVFRGALGIAGMLVVLVVLLLLIYLGFRAYRLYRLRATK
jgi:protoporphyrinogen IX oxidase